MLRRDIRLLVFFSTIVLLAVLFYQSQLQDNHRNKVDFGIGDFKDLRLDPNRNLKSLENKQSKSAISENNKGGSRVKFTSSLSKSVIDDVKRFVFFVGYARSGHSIIASMLDAHPHIVISHEYALFTQWVANPEFHSNKTWLFNTLHNNSVFSTESGLRTSQAVKKGYSLSIRGSWQGQYDQYITVIGDKSGGKTAQVYRNSHEQFLSIYHQLKSTVKVPVVVIHVLRNPYDNIATMLLYNTHEKPNVNSEKKYSNFEALESQITSYFNQVRSVVEMIKAAQLTVVEVHSIDLIANPKVVIRSLCNKLVIECTPEYLHLCAMNTFTAESQSRHLVEWTPYLMDKVAENIKQYKHLQRYSFY